MKWQNIDCGAGLYYITSTFTEWMNLFTSKKILQIVRDEIINATEECNAGIIAYVFMPNHLHLIVNLTEDKQLHRYCKLWRGRSAIHITSYLKSSAISELKREDILTHMETHANGTAKYTVWKEQPRALYLWNKAVLQQKIDYIHNNPVRASLVQHPGEWQYSSWRYYEGDNKSILPIATWV